MDELEDCVILTDLPDLTGVSLSELLTMDLTDVVDRLLERDERQARNDGPCGPHTCGY